MTDKTLFAPQYVRRDFTASSVTCQSIIDSVKRMKWLEYEVAPEWQKFCEFGPDDIGGVWEQIGAIRKRPVFSMVVVSNQALAAINRRVERDILCGSDVSYSSYSHDAALYGVRVIGSPCLAPDRAFLLNGDIA
jgi:hypothetical protein